MRAVRSIPEWRALRAELDGRKIGFVPTMGALHAGHRSLLERARRENELTVLSIFVNPTQFDEKQDFEAYPQTLDADLRVAEAAGVDYVLCPEFSQIYPDQYRYKVSESELSRELCGKHRPGHFDGVLTVVMKLLNLVRPGRAYFGEKDFQQYLLIKDMVEAFFMDVEIIPCPIVRDVDGLALSSRNVRLSPQERERAVRFPEALRSKRSLDEVRATLVGAGFDVDYVEELRGRRLGAVRLGAVRLIDNV